MSRKNIIKENNKKLFESRLQMKTKTNTKRTQISFEHKRFSDNLSILNNSQPYTKIIFQKQLKNHSTLENSFLNNLNNLNNSINKKIIKINKKNRNKKQNFNLNISQNKSNILIKDITFFHLKKSPKNREDQNKTIINVNKRITKQNSKNKNININIGRQGRPKTNRQGGITLNIKKTKKNNRNINFINSITRSMTTINESNNNITINNSNYIMNNTNININNINNGNNRVILKEKFIPKFKITNDMYIKIPNRHYRTNLNSNRNESNSNKKFNRHNSFLLNKIQKIQKIKFGKRQNININLNNTNFNTRLNDVIFGSNINQKGRNSINLFKNNINNNKKTIDICKGFTQRNLFFGKYLGKLFQKKKNNNNNSIKYSNNNSKRKNNNNTLNLEKIEIGYNSNRNLNNKNTNYLNKFIFKEKDKIKDNDNKKISRNIKNNNKKAPTQQSEISKKKLINNIHSEEFNDININLSSNNFINQINKFKDIDKTEQIIEDNINGTSTKINDEFFSTEKNKKIDTSIEEESGILSMNEVQDIIHYNDMNDIRKENKYLFNYNDYNIFVEKYKQKICDIFFDNKDNINNINRYNQNKLRSKKKYVTQEIINNYNNKEFEIKNCIGFKIFSHNNSTKKK